MPTPSLVNQQELRIVGMSRSGNHAIIQWIRKQHPGRVCFLNCAEPRTNPFETARPLDDGRRAIATYEGFDLAREAAGRLTPKDLLIHSYEDCFLSTVCHPDFEERHDQYVGASERRLDVLILRDPFNLFASRMHSQYGGVTPKTTVRIWTQHAREFLGERRYVTQELVPISFNDWSSDRGYRKALATQLGIPFSDRGFRTVASTGGGSSFDRRQFDGRADRMNVQGRWRHFRRDEAYRSMFDEQVLRLSDAIFGPVEQGRSFASFRKQLAAGN